MDFRAMQTEPRAQLTLAASCGRPAPAAAGNRPSMLSTSVLQAPCYGALEASRICWDGHS